MLFKCSYSFSKTYLLGIEFQRPPSRILACGAKFTIYILQ
jgi:hypothetical protein